MFGAGIAGLSAAHELARLGYKVSVYEANRDAGGFFRSTRVPEHKGMPSEYSWHGFGPWYHNAFDVMKQIPFDETGSVYDKGLSRPIDFGIAHDKGGVVFNDSWLLPVSKMLGISGGTYLRWAWLMLMTWTSNRRSVEHYSRLNAAQQWEPILDESAWKTWRATFGPWIGSDWTNVSLHTAGEFFRKLLITMPFHSHGADNEGEGWRHGQGDGWLVLRGPSNECWFDKWVAHLKKNGVDFFWKEPLHKFDFDGRRITAARLGSGAEINADIYVLATNPFSAVDVLDRTPALAEEEQLRKFRPLTGDGAHTQVSFRIAFSEKIAWPRKRAAIIVADSEFNLTIFAQDQVWGPEVDLGAGVKSLWTGTSCVGNVPGRIYGLPVVECSKDQFIEEVVAQLFSCKGLDSLIKEANDGRGLEAFPIVRVEVWHEWIFSPTGLKPHQPKWVTTTNTQPHQPKQATSVPNLVLAGAHTETAADVWSIEGAVESGRLAAKAIDPRVEVFRQYKPLLLRSLAAADDAAFDAGAPHILILAAGISAVIALLAGLMMMS